MTRRDLPHEVTQSLLSDRRSDAAAELHALDSWRARTAYVRDLAKRHGITPTDTRGAVGWRLRMFGKTAVSTAGEDGALSNWAQAVMKEFPEARP